MAARRPCFGSRSCRAPVQKLVRRAASRQRRPGRPRKPPIGTWHAAEGPRCVTTTASRTRSGRSSTCRAARSTRRNLRIARLTAAQAQLQYSRKARKKWIGASGRGARKGVCSGDDPVVVADLEPHVAEVDRAAGSAGAEVGDAVDVLRRLVERALGGEHRGAALDTGPSITMVSFAVAQRLRLQPRARQRSSTPAAGSARCCSPARSSCASGACAPPSPASPGHRA